MNGLVGVGCERVGGRVGARGWVGGGLRDDLGCWVVVVVGLLGIEVGVWLDYAVAY